MIAMVNSPHPDRIQLLLGDLSGPLTSVLLGDFDPKRDVDIYYNGRKLTPVSSMWDAPNNRYLLFLGELLSFDPVPPVVQVIHHMPASPFMGVEPPNPDLGLVDPGLHPDILAGE